MATTPLQRHPSSIARSVGAHLFSSRTIKLHFCGRNYASTGLASVIRHLIANATPFSLPVVPIWIRVQGYVIYRIARYSRLGHFFVGLSEGSRNLCTYSVSRLMLLIPVAIIPTLTETPRCHRSAVVPCAGPVICAQNWLCGYEARRLSLIMIGLILCIRFGKIRFRYGLFGSSNNHDDTILGCKQISVSPLGR